MHHTPVCIFGEVLLDCFADGRQVIGGAPFNVAWHLSAFGETPRLLSALGEDPEGQRIRDAMADWGMDLSGLQSDPDHPTGLVRVHDEAGEPSREVPPECAFDHIRRVRGDPHCALLYHGTLALRGARSAATLNALRAQGPDLIFLDCKLHAPWWSTARLAPLLRGAHWVKVDRAAFGLIADGADGAADDRDLAARAAAFRAEHGLTGLIIDLGAAGTLAVTATEAPLRIGPVAGAVPMVPAGAEDAFTAVVLLGLRHQWPLPDTLERARQFASCIGACEGSTVLDPGRYEPFIDQWGLAPQELPSLIPPAAVAPPPASDSARPRGRSRRA